MARRTAKSRVPATPIFDELYDTARQLGTCEVVLEHIPYERRRPGLALVVRSAADGRAVHRAVVRSSIEEAAERIRQELQDQTPRTGESE